jgi:hypothetical protein
VPLFAFERSVVPSPGSAWDGSSPLRNGLAIAANGEVGTLGACVIVRGQAFFTCARHVVGAADDPNGTPTWIWRGSQPSSSPWQVCQSLRMIPDRYQPGQELYDPLDIAFLEASSPATNSVGGPVGQGATVPVTGTPIRYRGCRRGWVGASFDGQWAESTHASAFDPKDLNSIDTTCCGVISFEADGYDYNDYPGDSGSAMWAGSEGSELTCVGQLIGVSPTVPIGLVVLYRLAFAKLGIPAYQFVAGG